MKTKYKNTPEAYFGEQEYEENTHINLPYLINVGKKR